MAQFASRVFPGSDLRAETKTEQGSANHQLVSTRQLFGFKTDLKFIRRNLDSQQPRAARVCDFWRPQTKISPDELQISFEPE